MVSYIIMFFVSLIRNTGNKYILIIYGRDLLVKEIALFRTRRNETRIHPNIFVNTGDGITSWVKKRFVNVNNLCHFEAFK